MAATGRHFLGCGFPKVTLKKVFNQPQSFEKLFQSYLLRGASLERLPKPAPQQHCAPKCAVAAAPWLLDRFNVDHDDERVHHGLDLQGLGGLRLLTTTGEIATSLRASTNKNKTLKASTSKKSTASKSSQEMK